jgi:hypothetical protein
MELAGVFAPRVGAGEALDERDMVEGVADMARVKPGTASAEGGEIDRRRLWATGRRAVR